MEYGSNFVEIIPKQEPNNDGQSIEIEIPFNLLQYLNSDGCDVQNLCRLCFSASENMVPLLSNKTFGVLADMLSTITSIKVNPGDGLPQKICELCRRQILHCYEFKLKCEKSNFTLKSLLKGEFMAKITENGDSSIKENGMGDYSFDKEIKSNNVIHEDMTDKKANLTLKVEKRGKRQNELINDRTSRNRSAPDRQVEINISQDAQFLDSSSEVHSDEDTLYIVQSTGNKNKNDRGTFNNNDKLALENLSVSVKSCDLQKSYDCPFCSKTFFKLRSLNHHLKQNHDEEKSYPFSCKECKEKFNSEHDLYLHSALHGAGPTWTCSKCQKEFKGRSMLGRHIQRHMESKRYSCETCGKAFAEMYALRRHQRVHTGEAIEKKLACHICDKRYGDSGQLAVHVARHSGARPHACACGKAFPSARLLASHRLVHSDRKPYACTYCDKRFRHESTRNTHHRTHTGEKPYVCSFCGKTFIQNSNLTLHLRVHTGEKPYSCSTCHRKFTSGSSLKSHQRTHTGEKPYSCQVCGKKFARMDLRAHMRLHTGERPFACNACPKKFINASRYREHCRIHTGEKPFECALCDQKFTTKSHLMKHMKSHAQKKKKINKREVVLLRQVDYNGPIIVTDGTQVTEEVNNIMSNKNIVLETEEMPMEVTSELIVPENGEVKTEILVVGNGTQYDNNVCLADGVAYINSDAEYGNEVNLVAVNEGEVSISASSTMLEGATVKLYQLDQSLVQIHSSGGQVTISKITSKMTANF